MTDVRHNSATSNRPLGDRVIDNDLFVKVDFDKYLGQLREEHAWQHNDRNAITVFKTDDVTIVVCLLHKGARIMKPGAEGLMLVQVLEGRIRFRADTEHVELAIGQLVMLHRDHSYEIEALEECGLLLSLCQANIGGI